MYDIKSSYSYDEATDTVYVYKEQDVEPLIEENKIMADNLREVPGLGYHAGRIPITVVEEYCKRRGITWREFMSDDKHVRFLLQNRDMSKFRIWNGKW